jgi:Family of unknown function (DUF6508)
MCESKIYDKIKSLSRRDWADLERLHGRIIEHTGTYSTVYSSKLSSGVIQLPYIMEAQIVVEAREFFLYGGLVVSFDWPRWEEGRAMFMREGDDKFNDVGLCDVIKLLSAIIQNDRFCEGAWVNLFECGDVSKLMKRLLDFKPKDL